MDASSRAMVRRRAGNRCEYCHLSESVIEVAFHVEHVVARQHGGDDDLDNLALACDRCNLYKGPNLSAIDPVTNEAVPLFHPRRDYWDDHFRWRFPWIDGVTPIGRATARLLQMNAVGRVQLRQELGRSFHAG